MNQLIGIAILLFAIWLFYKLTVPGEPSRRLLSVKERQELRKLAHKKPYSPRFGYAPNKKHRN